MSYLKFDKQQLTNLERILDKEMLRTNRAGAYSGTTLIDCNTRKYHGLLVVPVPQLGRENFVLLSACDETVIQHGAEFNLGIHKFAGDHYSPRGHKYIREFHIDSVASTIYRVGGVVLQKERLLVQGENRVLICYTLLEANSPTTLRLRPLLAYRSVNALTHENSKINSHYQEIDHGISMSLYPDYPELAMQLNVKNSFKSAPDWYRGVEYYKEQERGYDYSEDLYVPGYFEVALKRGERVVFSAGTEGMSSRQLLKLFDSEKGQRPPRTDFKQTLRHAAEQLYSKQSDGLYLIAGYPWFRFRARDFFMALPGCTLAAGHVERFKQIMHTGERAIRDFISGKPKSTQISEITAPDVLLWFVWAVQQYAQYEGVQEANKHYGKLVREVLNFIREQHHPNLFLHPNHLLYTNGTEKPATWMNAMENGRPINPRTGYVVEINALWYNALKFDSELQRVAGKENDADRLNYQAEMTGKAFQELFWNGVYLCDYVVGTFCDREVRPNMLIAVALPYSPLDKKQQKSVLDLVTRELLTMKGLRSLSPKSGMYRPVYVGGELERDRNYHNGPVWPWTTVFFVESYLKVYKRSGLWIVERLLAGFESELSELTIGTLSELYDGNPPFKGHGAMSFAMSVGSVLLAIDELERYTKSIQEEEKIEI